jgi:hypothetical protein
VTIHRPFPDIQQVESQFVALPPGARAVLLTLVWHQLQRNLVIIDEVEQNEDFLFCDHPEWQHACAMTTIIIELLHALRVKP